MRGIVPDAILDRRDKIAFSTPDRMWARSLQPWFVRTFSSDAARSLPWLKRRRSAAGARAAHRAVGAVRLRSLADNQRDTLDRAVQCRNVPERRLAYFALDVPHKGQASHIHISEIVGNLRRLGWHIDLFAPEPASEGRTRRPIERIVVYSAVIARAIVAPAPL